jgi:hypothetical protein
MPGGELKVGGIVGRKSMRACYRQNGSKCAIKVEMLDINGELIEELDKAGRVSLAQPAPPLSHDKGIGNLQRPGVWYKGVRLGQLVQHAGRGRRGQPESDPAPPRPSTRTQYPRHRAEAPAGAPGSSIGAHN